jgi:hypothetical protein
MRYLAALISMCIVISATKAETIARPAPAPRAILWFVEHSYWTGIPMDYPLPSALRLLVYSDGTVITRSRWYRNQPDPGFWIGKISAADAASLVERVRTQMIGAAHRSGRDAPDNGTTVLEFWDAQAGKREHYESDSWPCGIDDQERQALSRLRGTVDSGFLRVCDELLLFRLAEAERWIPQKVLIVLKPTSKQSDRVVAWPSKWPRTWTVYGHPREPRLIMCVPIEAPLPPLASEFLGLSGNWLTLQGAGIEGPDTAGWIIHKWWPTLPGPLATIWRGKEGIDYPGDCAGANFGFAQ